MVGPFDDREAEDGNHHSLLGVGNHCLAVGVHTAGTPEADHTDHGEGILVVLLVVVRSLGEADIQHQQVAADNLGNIQGTHHDSLEEAVVDKAAQDKANLWPCEEGEELLDAVVELGILEAVKLGDVVTELALLILVVAEMGH